MKIEIMRFYIPIRPVTKKNNMQVTRGKNGRPGIRQSKRYVTYEKAVIQWWDDMQEGTAKEKSQVSAQHQKLYGDRPIDFKINIKSIYGLPTSQRADLINYHAALHDILTKMGVIEDDHWKIVYSTDGSKVVVDRYSPGSLVIIEAYVDSDNNYISLM